MAAEKLTVKGIDVRYQQINGKDFISLTDIARYKNTDYPSEIIQNWMRNRSTVEFLGLWERLYNADFNYLEFEVIDKESGRNAFVLTPKRWIESVNAAGMTAKQGRYAETFAHKDIAFKFASWISVEFELYIIKEFQRLKENEQIALEWTAKRELAKVNYHIHTDAIKENLIVPELTQKQISFVYANEADMLNVALFGKTAGEWRTKNPDKKGNMRDYASVEQLLVLANLESYNAILIEQGLPQAERIVLLNKTARKQLETLMGARIQYDKLLALPKGKNKK
ncbi:KilA-N domian containing protein [Candidatus Termititenax persephonae]|uniref:KilA-N domian containing protein n=1 Tax=Candidatus Termititenax persephonae TaxID=2218525 RepID=A0A388TJQ0_9BACT|nr:KilA-N domian containing protein [Candidatus Termititenax persephonae]